MTQDEADEDDKILFGEVARSAEEKLLLAASSLQKALFAYPIQAWDGHPDLLKYLDEAITMLCDLRAIVLAVRDRKR